MAFAMVGVLMARRRFSSSVESGSLMRFQSKREPVVGFNLNASPFFDIGKREPRLVSRLVATIRLTNKGGPCCGDQPDRTARRAAPLTMVELPPIPCGKLPHGTGKLPVLPGEFSNCRAAGRPVALLFSRVP